MKEKIDYRVRFHRFGRILNDLNNGLDIGPDEVRLRSTNDADLLEEVSGIYDELVLASGDLGDDVPDYEEE